VVGRSTLVNCLGYQHERILTNASLALCSISENDAVERHNIQLHGLVQHLRSAGLGMQYAYMMANTSCSLRFVPARRSSVLSLSCTTCSTCNSWHLRTSDKRQSLLSTVRHRHTSACIITLEDGRVVMVAVVVRLVQYCRGWSLETYARKASVKAKAKAHPTIIIFRMHSLLTSAHDIHP
jgi:hypothetical protein